MVIVQKINHPERAWNVFLIFLRLGLTSFGGPVAHLGYFRNEFVVGRHWLSERNFADLVALSQFLPGPASSQVGMALGMVRGGFSGALAAWAGFTLPSAIILSLFGMGLATWASDVPAGALHGLKVVAVAVVAQAVWAMARNLCTDAIRIGIASISACTVLVWPTALGQILVIVFAAAAGVALFKPTLNLNHEPLPITITHRMGVILLGLFFGLLLSLPILLELSPNHLLALVNSFYRAGSLVFGGGHVVLPLLQAAVVPSNWVTNETFLAGYALAQAVPGPLFAFAAFLGATSNLQPNGWIGALICLIAIFLPSFLLIFGVLPFWERMRHSVRTQAALGGVNAAVVGLLLAALYHPVWVSAIFRPADFGLALVALIALMFWKQAAWLVVLGCGVIGWVFGFV